MLAAREEQKNLSCFSLNKEKEMDETSYAQLTFPGRPQVEWLASGRFLQSWTSRYGKHRCKNEGKSVSSMVFGVKHFTLRDRIACRPLTVPNHRTLHSSNSHQKISFHSTHCTIDTRIRR
jgi:hypothetical protein